MPNNLQIETAEPYEYLARIYDQVMEHVNYRQWARYIKTILTANIKNLDRLADISCGTGSILAHLNLKDTQFFGTDLSSAMLREAIRKKVLTQKRYLCADYLQLPFKNEMFDAIVVLYDSVNYLHTPRQVKQFFFEIHRVLNKKGILIFDAVTPYICKTVFREYQESQQLDDNIAYERRSWFDAKEQIQYNEFQFSYNQKSYEELHEQKIRSVSEWKNYVKKSPLKLIDIYANFTFRPIYRKAERAHFVCRKTD